jgi:NAD(P)-dependent dehydrogenase (short-subunit alcohol dehydrogenase family)
VRADGAALVTGASRGLGRALSLELARRGFHVLATMREPTAGRTLPAEVGGSAGSLSVARLDVERPETVDVPRLLAEAGLPPEDGLRVLVNNAGVESTYEPVEHAPADDWRRTFETNVFGLVETTRRALPSLRAAGGAVVCNVTSASLLFPMPFFAAYRASKAAVSALSESLAAELAEHRVRVLEVLPGPIATDLLAGSDREFEGARHAPYRRLAAWAWRGRRDSEAAKTPAAEAARRIADAILDDASPLRVACDPVGETLLAGADAAPHAERMAAALRAMSPDDAAG